jgi:hypothetical protein
MQEGRAQRAVDHARSCKALISNLLLSPPSAANDLPELGSIGALPSTIYCVPDQQEEPASE